MSSQKRVTETQVKQAIRRALKRVLKEIENVPALVIELTSDNTGADRGPMEDVQGWLFRKREEHNDD